MKKFSLFFTLLISLTGFSQNVLKGTITDENGQPIPGVRIAVQNSTYGVPSNSLGKFYLQLEARQDTAIVKFSMLGFETDVDTILLSNSVVVYNKVLIESSTNLNTVEIIADKRDFAKEVMQKLIDNKSAMQKQYDSYQCNTYIKTSLEKEPKKRKNKPAVIESTDSTKNENNELPLREKMNFIESVSITQFQQSNTFKETILAHQDYSEKSSSNVEVAVEFSNPNSPIPGQVIEHNPYIFYEKVEDGDFNLYQNLVNLPKVASNPIISPLSFNAFVNYKFTLSTVFFEGDQKIYEILVEPRFKEVPLFSGSLFVMDSLWILKSIDLAINPRGLEFFSYFRIIEDYVEIDSNWVAERREFTYTISDGPDLVLGNTRVHHENYQFNLPFNRSTFNNVVMEYDEEAFNKDSAYWVNSRPIQLKTEELEFIHVQDSIERVLTSDAYIDSVNNDFNKVLFWDVVLNGVGFRSRTKKQEIYINPLIAQIQPLAVGGYRHRLGGHYEKEFDNAQAIRVEGQIDYGFRNKDVKGFLGTEYTYLPRHFGSLKIKGGDIYDFVTMDQSLTEFFSLRNRVQKKFISISQRYEIVNGLYGRLTFDYSKRLEITGLDNPPWVDSLESIGLWSKPQPFDTYTVSIFELQMVYRFKQSYILKGNKKLIIGTEYPELRMTYKKGVPKLFGSDVNFDFLEIGISDKVNFGTFGDLKWDFEAGTFFGKSASQVQFIERRFFRGSDLLFFSDPLNTLQLLDSTFNTTRPYTQIFAIHHFNGALLGRVPLINKTKIEVVAGFGGLFIEEANYRHLELYAGLERKIKIRKQLFKLSAFYVIRENNAAAVQLNFKIGVDFFNTFNNSWSY